MVETNKVDEKKSKTNNTNGSDYFQSHKCSLPLNKIDSNVIQCGRLRRCFLRWTTVNTSDVRAISIYRSYASMKAEQYRQFKHYPYSVHPYSKLRIYLETILAITFLITDSYLATHYITAHYIDFHPECFMIIVVDEIYLILIITNFFTGYIEGDSCKRAVFDLTKRIIKYATSWLLIDLAIFISPLIKIITKGDIVINLSVESLKILRMPLIIKFFNNILTYHEAGILSRSLLEMFILIYMYLVWNIYFQFVTEYLFEQSYLPENPRNCSWLTQTQLWNGTFSKKFAYAIDRSVGMLRQNINADPFASNRCSEMYLVVAWIIGKIIIIICVLKYVIMLISSESAYAKYLIMAQQVQNYMNQRKFPPRIKKKIMNFYSIKFQSHFFVESRMMSCVSGQLKEDLIMFICRQLVGDVPFLKQLPRQLLLQIAVKLKIVIFMHGDIIFKINTVGDCLYFIDKGTVAIYTESGKEVCHLDDGEIFGEIALVMPQNLRTTSAVAISNCELFCLSKEDFESSIACYPTVYENVKNMAHRRMFQTFVLNDHHKTEMKMIRDHKKQEKHLL